MDRPVNLLALDGGGIRGLSELLILDEIMKRVAFDTGSDSIPRPCDYFDLICGTSTGRLIAIMLGRLGMTTDDAIRQYIEIAKAIFSKSNRKPYFWGETYKATTLENELKELVSAKGLGDLMMRAPAAGPGESAVERHPDSGCRAFVCAMPARNMAHPQRFRTYGVRENASPNCYLWEAARATTATPTLFKPIAIAAGEGHAPQRFVDGGFRCNNPVRELLAESRAVFGGDARLGCLVSLGAGRAVDAIGLTKFLPANVLRAMADVATDCEKEAHSVAQQFGDPPDRYFRFSVAHGTQGMLFEEWERMGELTEHTAAYMKDVAVSRSIDRLVQLLCGQTEPGDHDTEITLNQLMGDVSATIRRHQIVRMRHRHAVSALFKGRGKILGQLEGFFVARAAGSHPRREFLLHGMGGSGKSQIALKFAEEYEERFSQVFWLDATNEATIEQSYKEIASTLRGGSDDRLTVYAARALLASLQEEWLLLVDGADDVNAMAGLWPPGRIGNIIYTSRNPVLKAFAPDAVCEVAAMDEVEAVELLLDAARLRPASDEVSQAARHIVAELGSLALAVDQAGAYIAQGECRIDNFLAIFGKHRASMLGVDAYKGATDYERAVYATWELSCTAIERKASSTAKNAQDTPVARNALRLLGMLAYFHYESVTEEIFLRAAENPKRGFRYPPDIDPEAVLATGVHLPDELLPLDDRGRWDCRRFFQAVSMLSSYSLVFASHSSGAITMHRLVHGWAFDRLSPDKRRMSQRFTAATLAGSVGSDDDSEYVQFNRSLLPHVTTLLRQAAIDHSPPLTSPHEVMALAEVYNQAGRWNEAAELRKRALELLRKVLGEEHIQTLISMGNLAVTMSDQGRAREAEELQRHVLERIKSVLGPEHPDAFSSMSNLASSISAQGRTAEAEELHRRTLELRKRELGPEHPDTLSSLNNIATLIMAQGRAAEAEEWFRRELQLTRRVLGAEHPATLTVIGNLASSLWAQRRAAEAEEMHRDELEIKTRVLGAEHPNTLTSMANLALTVRAQGRAAEAEELHRQTLELKKLVLGAEHPQTLSSMNNLAYTMRSRGREAEAENLHREELEIKTRVLGAAHPATLITMGNLALAIKEQGRADEAEELQQRQFQLRKSELGAEHPATLSSMKSLASTMRAQGREAEGEELHRQQLELSTKVLGAEHPDTLSSKHSLAVRWYEQGKRSEAMAAMLECYEIKKKTLGANHRSTTKAQRFIESWRKRELDDSA